MFQKIVRVMVLSVTATVLPGVIVACSSADAGPVTGTGATPVTGTSSATPMGPSAVASMCTKVTAHDDAKCNNGGYTLLDEVNDESCSALNDSAEDAMTGALTLQVPSSVSKSSPPTFSWSKATAKLTPMQRFLDILEPSAHAHGRTDGVAYMLVFVDKSCTDVTRVFTKQTSWKADAATWAKITAAAGPISVQVFTATLDNSALKDGTVATGSKPLAFTIK